MQVSGWEKDTDGVDETQSSRDPFEDATLKAAEAGEMEKLKDLINSNKELVKAVDKDGYTPLHRACYGNHVEVVKYLLERNAPIDAETLDGWQPLHSACVWNNIDCISLLIQHGADVNALSKGQQTPLHLVSASSHNSPGLQLLLLHPDTNPHHVNASGDTAEKIAQRTGKYYSLYEIIQPCLNDI
ncbi:ankyrin repeat domain-containing protein 49-like isoform X1 [Leptopilina heterotoma]|uniref:ankyrin repeat domain-containing protein 49-like isoform X1 n=2 Tax=Leptopilina heterotoma TaxID=63436 RepID=UPI001CA9BCF5|nr:ankyrin repeat domain-containing protein 49-like isoform X1 [Leptopilina heterotoma]